MTEDPFGAGGLPRATPSPRLGPLLRLRRALRAAVRGAYGAAPGSWPGALDEAAAALGWLGPLRGPLLTALAGPFPAPGAFPAPGGPASLSAILSVGRPLGPLTLIAGDGEPAALALAPDAPAPPTLLAAAAAVAAPAGTPLEERSAAASPLAASLSVAWYDLGSEAAVEHGDVEFALADRWSRELADDLGADRPYLEAARRVLKHAAARRIAFARGLAEALRRTGRAERVLLVAGRDDWRPLAHDLLTAGLGESGFAVVAATRSLEARLAFARHVASLGAATVAPQPAPDRGTDPLQRPPAVETLVVGDLRQPAEPRRAPTLRALLARLGDQRGGVGLIEPSSGREARSAAARRLRRLGLGGVRPAPFLRRDLPSPADLAAARPALDRFAARRGAESGAGGFILEAARKMASEWPAARAAGAALEKWAAEGGRRCFLVQGGARFEASVAAEACRRGGASAIDVQTTIVSASPRYDSPLANVVCCIDSEQSDLLRDHFGLAPERLRVVGMHEIDLLRDRAAPAAPTTPGTIVFYPAQGLPRLDVAAIRLLAAADLPSLGLAFAVSPHPSMGARQRAAAEAAVGFPIPWTEGESLGRALAPDVLAVATLFSNVALRAALLGKPVIVLRILGASYPVRFDALGIARAAQDPAGVRAALQALREMPARHGPATTAYLDRNPQFLAGDTIARILQVGGLPAN